MYQRILVATDGSALSEKAVSHAIGLAALCGAELVAMTVVPRYPQGYFEGGMAMQPQDIQRVESAWADQSQRAVDAVKEQATAQGVTTKAVTIKSDLIADAIIAAVAKHHCDLVVMASHGRRGIQRLLLGSETLHVLTHATVPVLVLR
jgi:nucleotide-binding universal stress UspA family protein